MSEPTKEQLEAIEAARVLPHGTREQQYAEIRARQALEQLKAERLMVLRGVVDAEWARVVSELHGMGISVKPWPTDESVVATLAKGSSERGKAATFSTKIPAAARTKNARGLEDMITAVQRDFVGTAASIAKVISDNRVLPIVYVKCEPGCFYHVDESLGIRCRLGFGQDAKDDPLFKIATEADLERANTLTDAELMREEARARDRFRKLAQYEGEQP